MPPARLPTEIFQIHLFFPPRKKASPCQRIITSSSATTPPIAPTVACTVAFRRRTSAGGFSGADDEPVAELKGFLAPLAEMLHTSPASSDETSIPVACKGIIDHTFAGNLEVRRRRPPS